MLRSLVVTFLIVSLTMAIATDRPETVLQEDGYPKPPEGMEWTQWPPDPLFWGDPEWFDTLGRDQIERRNIFRMPSATDKANQIKQLLAEFPSRGLSMLFKAAVKGDVVVMETLLAAGVKAHPSEKDDMSCVPLHAAAFNGRLDCVRLLIDQGNVAVNALDDVGGTPLMRAAAGGRLEIVGFLLERGGEPTFRQASFEVSGESVQQPPDFSAVDLAAGQGHLEIVRLLLDNIPKDQHAVVLTQYTLAAAANRGSMEIVEFILKEKAFPLKDSDDGTWKGDLLSTEQRTAIQFALALAAGPVGSLPVLRLLLGYLTPTDEDGNLKPLTMSLEEREFIKHGLLVQIQHNDPEGLELLWNVLFNPQESELDTDPERKTKQEEHIFSLISFAASTGSLECTRLLIEKYAANLKNMGEKRKAALLYVAATENAEVVRYLLENTSPDIHLSGGREANGPTPLVNAIVNDKKDIVKLLLQHGGPVEEINHTIRPEEPAELVVMAKNTYRTPVSLVWKDDAGELTQQGDLRFVVLDVTQDDAEWLSNLQKRKSDDELREEGEDARPLREP